MSQYNHPKQRKSDQDGYSCKFESYIIEMHSDIKSLVNELRSINGCVKDTIIDIRDTKKLVSKHSVYWGLLIALCGILFIPLCVHFIGKLIAR